MSIFDEIDKMSQEELDRLETVMDGVVQHRRRRSQLSDEVVKDEVERLDFMMTRPSRL